MEGRKAGTVGRQNQAKEKRTLTISAVITRSLRVCSRSMRSKPLKLPKAPPPALGCRRVLAYAVVDGSVEFSGRTLLFVDGKELGPVERLAICKSQDDPDYLLVHCNKRWDAKGVSAYASMEEAKSKAESIYRGLSSHWIDPQVSEEAAEAYLDELFGDQRCAACGKRADKVDKLFRTESGYVCPSCKSTGRKKSAHLR